MFCHGFACVGFQGSTEGSYSVCFVSRPFKCRIAVEHSASRKQPTVCQDTPPPSLNICEKYMNIKIALTPPQPYSHGNATPPAPTPPPSIQVEIPHMRLSLADPAHPAKDSRSPITDQNRNRTDPLPRHRQHIAAHQPRSGPQIESLHDPMHILLHQHEPNPPHPQKCPPHTS